MIHNKNIIRITIMVIYHHFKNGIFILIAGSFSLLYGVLLMLPLIIFFPDYRALMYLSKKWANCIMMMVNIILGIKYQIIGKEFIPTNSEFIIASKHQTLLETLILTIVIPNPLIILKKELLHIPLIGWVLKSLSMIAIDRKNPITALKSILKQAKDSRNSYKTLIIFPEGSRNNTEIKYNAGIFMIVKSLKKGVIPVALNCKKYWTGLLKQKKIGTITIEFLPPIQYQDIQVKEQFIPLLQTLIENKTTYLMGK